MIRGVGWDCLPTAGGGHTALLDAGVTRLFVREVHDAFAADRVRFHHGGGTTKTVLVIDCVPQPTERATVAYMHALGGRLRKDGFDGVTFFWRAPGFRSDSSGADSDKPISDPNDLCVLVRVAREVMGKDFEIGVTLPLHPKHVRRMCNVVSDLDRHVDFFMVLGLDGAWTSKVATHTGPSVFKISKQFFICFDILVIRFCFFVRTIFFVDEVFWLTKCSKRCFYVDHFNYLFSCTVQFLSK